MTHSTRKQTIVTLAIFVAGCSAAEAPVEREKSPRPVTVLVLDKPTTPQRNAQLAGSVTSWKTERIGFQVAGRVEMVLEPGEDIRGRTVDEDDNEITQPTVIARLERERYEVNLASAMAQKETAAARAQAKKSELEQVIPQQIKAAEAAVTLTQLDFQRVEGLFKQKAASKAQYDEAEAKRATAAAKLAQSKASKAVAGAELASLYAQEKEAEEAIRSAEKDMKDTLLISPYHGQVAEVHEIPGGYVQAGEPVVTVQMMDPIMVEVAVSAETDAKLSYNDTVDVHLPDIKDPVQAMVYEKAAVADAATRTFNVTLLVRNEKIEVGLPEDGSGDDLPRIRALWRMYTEKSDRSPPFFVNTDSLYKYPDGFFVWKAEGWTIEQRNKHDGSTVKLRKVRVVPGEKRLPFLQVAIMRELTDTGELDGENDLVAGVFFDPKGNRLGEKWVVDNLKDGDEVAYVRERWRLRPGDIVRVDLLSETLEPGFYVPTDAILEKSGQKYVFVVDGSMSRSERSGNVDQVRQVEVRVSEGVETLRRIEAVGDKPLADGTKIVAAGALFLTDGEKITVVEEVKPTR